MYNSPVPLLCDLCVRGGNYGSYMVPLDRLTAEGKHESDHPYRCGIHESREYSKFLGYYSNYPARTPHIPPPLSLGCQCGSNLYMYICGATKKCVIVRCIECGANREENL